MIEVRDLTKTYGKVTAVQDLTFTVEPGRITGFLGPNGAGKSTTMRMIVGLDRPTSGTATINGQAYRSLKNPLATVGTLLDAKAVHPNRSAANHLLMLARANGLPKKRVDEVLGIVGLTEVAGKKAGGFSLGMGQRLGLAGAMLGDPEVLILDEPVNGLDPNGIRWVRTFLQKLASEGRTVFVSSHLLSEMALMADDLVVIGQGKLITTGSVADLINTGTHSDVVVRTPNYDEFLAALRSENYKASEDTDEQERPVLRIAGTTSDEIGALAYSVGVHLSELTEKRGSLEDAFMQITHDAQQYRSDSPEINAATKEGQN